MTSKQTDISRQEEHWRRRERGSGIIVSVKSLLTP